jgi:hypothetical protein
MGDLNHIFTVNINSINLSIIYLKNQLNDYPVRTYALTTARNCGLTCSLVAMKPLTNADTTSVTLVLDAAVVHEGEDLFAVKRR